MDLKSFLQGLPLAERKAFAKACGTSLGHLRNTIYDAVKGKVLAAETCCLVEIASKGQVRRWDLRPLDWCLIWPELIGVPGAPPAKFPPRHPKTAAIERARDFWHTRERAAKYAEAA